MVKLSNKLPCVPSEMDGNSSDNSHSCSEIGGVSWIPGWENDVNSLAGLNLGSGLQGLVDDKDIAARAVAFVVNSTRKGIVPLCADIASLLRSKQCLEKKILLLRNENQLLRSSASGSVRTSQSTSPISASINSYNDKTLYPDDNLQNGDHPSRPCSQCSQCSSTLSNSPKLEKAESFITSDLQQEAPSGGDPGSEALTSTPNKSGNIAAVVVNVKRENSGKRQSGSGSSSLAKNKLPEITSEPNCNLPKIKPASRMISRETQCSFSRKRDQAVEAKRDGDKPVSKENSLVEDLGAARREIEILKAKLKELEAAPKIDSKFHVENEVTGQKTSLKPVDQKSTVKPTEQKAFVKPTEQKSTTKPTEQKAVVKPTEQKAVVKPTDQKAFVKPTEQKSTTKPTEQKAAVKSTEHKATVKPTEQKSSVKPTEQKSSVKPTEQKSSVKSTEHKAPVKSAEPPTSSTLKSDKSNSSPGVIKPKPAPKQLSLTSISPPLKSHNASVAVLAGCKCMQCLTAAGDQNGLPPLSPNKRDVETPRFRINSILEIKLGDHVLTKDEASGYVRYIGHLDKNGGELNKVFVGLALDAPGGVNDGFIHGKRYFLCHRDHGIFLPIDDVVCVLEKKSKESSGRTDVVLNGEKSGSKSKTNKKTHSKLGERLTLMLQKSRRDAQSAAASNSASAVSGKPVNGPLSTSSPTTSSPQAVDPLWMPPYREITPTTREGPVV